MDNISATHTPNDQAVDNIFTAIARWINNYREAFSTNLQLAECGSDEVARIAHDLMIPRAELANLARRGPEGARLLSRMLVALGVDPKVLAESDPATMRDLQRLCVNCDYKRSCEHALAQGKAAESYREFCPNAFTLDALFGAKSNPFFWESDDGRRKQ
jgi:pyrroloquinoline quinone (PQQ) biosynthesis protein C